jgi:hypothetical protein
MASHISSKIIFTIASTQVQQLWTMVIQRKLGNIGLTYPGTYKPHSLGTMVAYTFSKTPNIGILFLDRTHQANRTQSHWRIGGVKTNKHTRNVTRSGKSKYHPLYLLWELMFHNHNEQICLHSAARWIVSAGTEHLSPQRSLVQFLRQFSNGEVDRGVRINVVRKSTKKTCCKKKQPGMVINNDSKEHKVEILTERITKLDLYSFWQFTGKFASIILVWLDMQTIIFYPFPDISMATLTLYLSNNTGVTMISRITLTTHIHMLWVTG